MLLIVLTTFSSFTSKMMQELETKPLTPTSYETQILIQSENKPKKIGLLK